MLMTAESFKLEILCRYQSISCSSLNIAEDEKNEARNSTFSKY
jgi:hypothetical protein